MLLGYSRHPRWPLSGASSPGLPSCSRFRRSCLPRYGPCSSRSRRSFSRKEGAHKLAPMGAASDPAGNYHVPFGDLLLDREDNVGESRVVGAYGLIDILGPAAQLGVTGSMADV